MLAFVIPLVSPQMSRDWSLVARLTRRTLASACQQEAGSYIVLLVGNAFPDHLPGDPCVECIPVDFALELSVRDPVEYPKDPNLEVRFTDKGRKMLRGYLRARELGATHIMFLDADDLVSCRLASLIGRNPHARGWAIEKGYRYVEGSDWVYVKRRGFHRECGSGVIVRADLVPVPTPEFDRGFCHYRFFINHQYQGDKMRRAGQGLARLPFRGAVYVIHSSNTYARRHHLPRRLGESLLRATKNLFNTRRIGRRVREEFNLHPLEYLDVAEGASRAGQFAS